MSIQTAVSFAYFGASKQTEVEMKNALFYGEMAKTDLAQNFQTLTEEFNKIGGLQIANKLFVQNQYRVKPTFNEIATKSFKSEAENLDFGKNVDAAKTINNWVESKTNNKIKDLISADSLDALTRMVLVNAIYFKGLWVNQFDPAKTFTGPFYMNDNDTVNVDFMTIKVSVSILIRSYYHLEKKIEFTLISNVLSKQFEVFIK